MKTYVCKMVDYSETIKADRYEIEEYHFINLGNELNIRRDYVFYDGKKIVFRVPVNFVEDLKEVQ